MLLDAQNIQAQSCNSFKSLKIINPKKMPAKMINALESVKGEFDNYPNASVYLKNQSKFGIYTQYYGSFKNHNFGRFIQSSLIFDLGKDSSKKAQRFSINSDVIHTSRAYDSVFKQLWNALPFSGCVKYFKNKNMESLSNRITSENITKKIKEL